MFTLIFWKAAAERSIKTVAQAAVATLTIGATTGLFDVDWQTVASVSLLSGVVSILTSIASDAVTGHTGPSLTAAEALPKHRAE